MSENEAAVIMVFLSNLLRIVAFVCVTVVAIYFQNTSLLWWYVLPALMGCNVKTNGKDEDNA